MPARMGRGLVGKLSQNIYGTRAEDGGDLKFALIYYKQRASYLAVKDSLRAGSEPRL